MADTDPDAETDDRIDAQLLHEIAAGVEQAFVSLYRRRHADVYRFAFAMAKSRTVAEDVMQEVFVNVLENAGRFDEGKGSARAWLYGCARYVTLDRLRLERRWTSEVPSEEACDADERLLTDQRAERLHAAIARLPVEYREALVLCDLHELSYLETARVLECPVGTVRSRLHRARTSLAVLLAESERPAGRDTDDVPAAAFEPRGVCS